ncbi:MAG: hypothetical protein GY857_07390, partial [Desulfobacula sp.]|nr:hypothetical protein [Desulfobacula sp.]
MTTLVILIGLTIFMLLAGFPLFACFGVGGLAMMFFLEIPSGFAVPAIFSGL